MPYRVMTVCTGNICRSPMAEIVLRARIADAGLDGLVVVDSSGISNEERGNPIDSRAATVLAHHGYPTGAGHRAHQVTGFEVADRQLLLAMTSYHARGLRRLAEKAGVDPDRVRMYRSFDPAVPALAPGLTSAALDIEDPWYGGREDFELVLTQLEAGVDGIIDHIRQALTEQACR